MKNYKTEAGMVRTWMTGNYVDSTPLERLRQGMTWQQIEGRIDSIERAIDTQDLSHNFLMELAGEWQGLMHVLGYQDATAWALLYAKRGM
jgi:hypothetical protein